eukprot:TRINITY_DN2969_c0_g1_i7.p1 TRINITY_DN2969_c0_g1~~TRINITY_DN2969_c0_g1_i7.p1  ORF type:complete len:101 (-),score=3.33 TRINITY_DN2969_c0_g1_i7:298-600(-)
MVENHIHLSYHLEDGHLTHAGSDKTAAFNGGTMVELLRACHASDMKKGKLAQARSRCDIRSKQSRNGRRGGRPDYSSKLTPATVQETAVASKDDSAALAT